MVVAEEKTWEGGGMDVGAHAWVIEEEKGREGNKAARVRATVGEAAGPCACPTSEAVPADCAVGGGDFLPGKAARH